jgi:cytoskeletal protein RodZ
VSIQDQTLIFRAQDLAPAGRHGEAAASASEPEPAASASEPTSEPEAAEPDPETAEPEPAEPQAAEPEPEPATDTTPADDDSTPAGKAATAGDRESTDDATTVTEAADPEPDLEVTVVPGVPRYHKSQCILIRFMGDSDLDKMTMAAARGAGCTPCRACLPDQSDGPSE